MQQRVALKAAGRPTDEKPYLLMLVRPDGIGAYYQTLHALNGLELDFGYELIDADWVLEFPAEGGPSNAQPWMTADKEPPKPGPNSTSLPPAPVGVIRNSQRGIWSGPTGNNGGVPDQASAVSSPHANTGRGGPWPGSGTGTNTAATGSADMRGGPAPLAGGSDSQAGPAIHAIPTGGWQPMKVGASPASGGASSSPSVTTGNGAATAAIPGQSGRPGGGIPTTPIMTAGGPAIPFAGGPPISGNSQGGVSQVPSHSGTAGAGSGTPSGTASSGTTPSGTAGPSNPAIVGGNAGGAGTAAPSGEPHSPTPLPSSGNSAGSKGSDSGLSQSDAADGQPGPSYGGERRRPLQGVDNDLVKTKRPARRPELRPAILGGDRDYIIMLECRVDSVVLYPYGNSFSAESLAAKNGGGVVLQEAISRMITRKQASVRPGEQPYRPQVRFMVRPDGLRSMHRAYPLLEELHVPLTRQNLDADEDVRLGD